MTAARALPRPHPEARSAATTTRVANRILEICERAGIDKMFGIPGGAISPIYDALYESAIDPVVCQHETMGAYAAIGYAKATGRPALVATTSGPGVTNVLTAVAAAFRDEVPLLVLVGEAGASSMGRAPLQDGSAAGLDIMGMFRSVTRYAETLWHPQRASAMVSNALAAACSVPKGPALLHLPVDVLQQTTQRCDGFVEPSAPPVAGASTCDCIASLLETAKRPAILLGVGARSTATARAALTMAELLRCPVITDLEGKGLMPESHPLALGIFGVGARGSARAYLEGGVDVLLTCGARLDDTLTAGYSELLQPTQAFVQLDHDPQRLGRSYHATMAVHADIAKTLERIVERLPIPDAQTLLDRDAGV